MRKFVKIICIFTIIITIVLLYSRYIATSTFKTNEIVIRSSLISDSYDSLKIVHLSDIHYKRIITEERIDEIIDEINLINHDIVVFTGDLIDKDSNIDEDDKNFLINKLSLIKAKYGKYAVIGNHDYMFERELLEDIYKQSDFLLLENSYDIVYNEKKDKLFIGGISNVSYNEADIDKTMAYFEENEDITYKIILVHEPDYSDTIINKYPDVNLILAGHSHNGQVNIPFLKELFLPAHSRKYFEGYYKINNTDLYVSNGIGVSRLNFRLFNSPSINFYRFVKVD